jgi:hypothetical protein
MSPRIRKLLGVALLLPGLGAYLFAAAMIGARLPAAWYFQIPFYALAGVFWALPAFFLIRWMERPPSRNGTGGSETSH